MDQIIKFINTPYPEVLTYPFKALWKLFSRFYQIPRIPEKAQRLTLLGITLLTLVAVWLVEGIINPIDLVLDVPFFSFRAIETQFQMPYIVFVPFCTYIFISLASYFLWRDDEPKFFSVNGLIHWLMCVCLGILAESCVRNFVLEWFTPRFEEAIRITNPEDVNRPIFLIAFLIVVYYSLRDLSTTAISMLATPFINNLIVDYAPTDSIFSNTLVLHLTLTAVLKLLLMLLESAGLLTMVVDFIKKYCFTVIYMPLGAIYMLLLPFFWPIFVIVHYVKKDKKKKKEAAQAARKAV